MSEPRAGLQSTGTTIIDGLVPMPVSVQFSGVPAGDWLALEVTVAFVEDPRELGITTPIEDWQAEEAHRIVISDGRAQIFAVSELGVLRAQRRLAVLEACAEPGTAVPGLVLVDHPAYRHRGLSLDVVRHFFDVDTIVRVMDLMADVALNVLHLHLTDDQAWRVEIPALPELTEVSGVGAVGGVAATEARGGLACGHYTLSDLGFLAAEAEARGITLLPEFDVPGHTNAALVAMPGLNPDGVVPAVHEGGEVGFSTIHIGAPDTERFLDEVIAALAPYAPIGVHIGGDECFATSREEYEALVGAIVAKVHDAGRRVIAWQEAAGQLREGDMVQMWDPRLSSAAVAEATRRGVKVLVSAANRVYLDMKQVEGQELGLDWMGIVPLRTALEWEPAEVVEGVVPGAIEGVEACLWTETVFTAADLGTMVLPRLTAVAEVAWAGSGVGQWESFRCRVAGFARLWRARGWAFFPDAGVTWP